MTRQPRHSHMPLAAALAGVLASPVAAPASAREAKELAAGWHRLAIEVDGRERWFRAFVPRRSMQGAPVVLLLHGGGRSMDKLFSKRAGAARAWPELAGRERFLLLAPNGVNSWTGAGEGRTQNWSDRRGGSNDASFLLKLLGWAHATFGTDAGRVYVTGASNGGTMTYRMLMEHPEVFAAGAAFVANLTRAGEAVSGPSADWR